MSVVQKQVQKWTTYKPKNYQSFWRQKIHRLFDHVGVLMIGAAILALVIGLVVQRVS